jgi:hypothetical protein
MIMCATVFPYGNELVPVWPEGGTQLSKQRLNRAGMPFTQLRGRRHKMVIGECRRKSK